MSGTYATSASLRAALEQRLRNEAAEGALSLLRLRKLVVFDRFLARLTVVTSVSWSLKGALALEFRLGPRARTTLDLDIARYDDLDAATEDLLAAARIDLGDHFSFAIERVRVDEVPSTARYRVRAELAGRTFEEVAIDVSFSDPFLWDPDWKEGPDLLRFAGIPPARVPVLPLEQHVAEKVHAYTRTYAGGVSSRPKDLIDLVLIARSEILDETRLREALKKTFDLRGTHSLPPALPGPPEEWGVPYAKLAEEVGLPPDLDAGYRTAAALLNPILTNQGRGHWNAREGGWKS